MAILVCVVLKDSMPGCSAVINRYGFNSKGVDAVRANLLSYRRGLLQRPVNKPGGLPGLVGVNLGIYPLHSLAVHSALSESCNQLSSSEAQALSYA